MKQKLLSLLFVLCCALPMYAQNGTFTIKGQVIDSLTSETVPYATLRISAVETPQTAIKLLACDDDGKFETTLSHAGHYLIGIQSIGKAPAEKQFTLTENNKRLDLGKLLVQEDNQNLAEVTVTAQKPLVKVEIDKLTYNLENDPEAQTNNTLEMLRKVPMVTVDGEDKIQLKGSSNYKIYLNGKPSTLLSGDNASDVLKGMPASSVKDIEVITEPGAKYDAEGVGGIINIITSKNALQGYTGTIRTDVSALGRMGAGGNISLKAGKFGLTANYNFRYQNNPWTDAESFQETLGEEKETIHQVGESKFKGPFQFGSLEASYEIDSLNLLTVGANLFNGNMKNYSRQNVEMNNLSDPTMNYNYHKYNQGKNTFGSTDINVDYQRSTQKKDELFTVSYRFSHSPDGSEARTELSDVNNYPMAGMYPRWADNNAYTNEHTVQVDYTTPLFNDHTLETGVKYILRQNDSETTIRHYNDSTSAWEHMPEQESDFKHTQHIYSAYGAYAIKYKKFSYKAGVRAEGTSLNAKFKKTPEQNFSTDYVDIVPNATVSYMLSMSQQLRLGYNMRIQRPSIWFLNPYVDISNPSNISYGNPHLDSEKSHNINLNYSLFNAKFNLNASANYTFVNNSIERYTFVNDEGVYVTTFDNIGKRQQVGAYLYGRWSPVPLFNISVNGGVNYIDYKADQRGLSNNGVRGNVYSNAQVNLPKDFRVNVYGGYYSPWIMLQGKGSGQYFTGLNVSKDFLNKKLSVSLSCNNPFWKTMKYEMNTTDEQFRMRNISHWRARDFSIRLSYTFGTLKDQIKKVRRGINNDDQKGGSQGGEGGGQGGM